MILKNILRKVRKDLDLQCHMAIHSRKFPQQCGAVSGSGQVDKWVVVPGAGCQASHTSHRWFLLIAASHETQTENTQLD